MNDTKQRLPRAMVPWLLLGLLAAVVVLAVAVLKTASATERSTRDATSARVENRALVSRIDGISTELADLRRQSDVKSQQLRDAGIPESPLTAPVTTTTVPPRGVPTPTTTTQPPTTTAPARPSPPPPAQPQPSTTTTAPGPPATTCTTLTIVAVCHP